METLKLSGNMISVSTKSISDQYLQDTYKDGRIAQLTAINAKLLSALEGMMEATIEMQSELENKGKTCRHRAYAIKVITEAMGVK